MTKGSPTLAEKEGFLFPLFRKRDLRITAERDEELAPFVKVNYFGGEVFIPLYKKISGKTAKQPGSSYLKNYFFNNLLFAN